MVDDLAAAAAGLADDEDRHARRQLLDPRRDVVHRDVHGAGYAAAGHLGVLADVDDEGALAVGGGELVEADLVLRAVGSGLLCGGHLLAHGVHVELAGLLDHAGRGPAAAWRRPG